MPNIRLCFPLQTPADRYLCFHIKSDIIRCFFLDYLTCNWWLRLSGVFYRTSFKHVATYMSWRTYIMYKVLDNNNFAHPVTCEDQYLTRMFNTLTWSQFVLRCPSQANSGVIGHVCCPSNYCFCLPLWHFQVQ